ncbi:MAG: DUF881 domain-containing protein [Janthinobacterium lividum]
MSELPTAPPPPRRRVDASMILLSEVMDRPLDPGYAAAAARRAERGTSRTPAAAMVGLLAALVIGVLLALAGVRAAAGAPAADRGRQDLLTRIDASTARADDLAARAARLRTDNSTLAGRLGGLPAAAADDQAQALAVQVGAVAVTGAGLDVSLDDAPGDPTEADPTEADSTTSSSGRVVDRDVQLLVNGLWQAGAEAIAVNGQRLTALSSIRAAGEAVLVDYRPLTPPYVVSAVGDPAALQTTLAASVAGRYLQVLADNYGIGVDITAHSTDDPLHLPAATRLSLRSAVAG